MSQAISAGCYIGVQVKRSEQNMSDEPCPKEEAILKRAALQDREEERLVSASLQQQAEKLIELRDRDRVALEPRADALLRDLLRHCDVTSDGETDWERAVIAARKYIAGRPSQPPDAGPLMLDTDTQVFFYEQDCYVLSNFSSFQMKWHNIDFPTSEHAYHWEKFIRCAPEVAERVRFSESAHVAFKIAERNKGLRRKDWDAVKVEIMRRILRAKVEQHDYVRRKLLATGGRELIENSWRDDYWGWGEKRDGQNMLGKLWMEIRAELRSSSQTKRAEHE
jgi:hypothetical protein